MLDRSSSWPRRRVRAAALALSAAALSVASGANAQDDALTARQRSHAAGYVAAFTCSATFNAGRSLAAIREGELARIYPDFRRPIAALAAPVVDRDAKTVSVVAGGGLAPRLVVWRPHLGCVQAPPGATPDVVAHLAQVAFTASPPARAAPWRPGPDPAVAVIAEAAFDGATYGDGTRTTAVVILRDGSLVAERYAPGFDAETPQRTWSVAKSLAATVIGAAIHQGHLRLDAPAPVPEWSAPGDPRAAITLANLLHMASGLHSGERGSRTDEIYFGGGRVKDHAATTELEAAPGTRWRYANNDTLLALRALRGALADEAAYLRFPFEAVLGPLGMTGTTPETDWNGDFVMSSQVWTTARDLARLGLLYLRDGVWEGARILPERWAQFVRTPAPAQPAGRAWGYGAQFWLLGGVSGLPEDAFAAAGHRGQYVVIIPSQELVVVRRGFDESGGTAFDIAAFTADVLTAGARAGVP